jgi:hypothetical protein
LVPAYFDLGAAKKLLFDFTGDWNQLREAIKNLHEAYKIHTREMSKVPDLEWSANGFAVVLGMLFKKGYTSPVASSIKVFRLSYKYGREDHASRSYVVHNLGTALVQRYEQTEQLSDLDEAIDRLCESQKLQGPQHPLLPLTLTNLAVALRTHILHPRQERELASKYNLQQVIDLHSQADGLFPPETTDKIPALHIYANSLLSQFDSLKFRNPTKAKKALDSAITKFNQAIDQQTPGHPGRVGVLHSLAGAYERCYDRDPDSLDEDSLRLALKYNREVLRIRQRGEPVRHLSHHAIARIKLRKWSGFDWSSALDHLSLAVSDAHAPVRERIQEAKASLAFLEAMTAADPKPQYLDSPDVLNIYTTIIQLFPLAAHFGLDTATRLRELAGTQELCHSASLRAIRLKQFPKAVELFEQGNSVFWGQALRMRSQELDRLPKADREALKDLFDKLQQGISPVDTFNPIAREENVEKRRQKNKKVQALLDEIRSRTGFERFLEIARFDELEKAAEYGMVIILVANSYQFAALCIRKKANSDGYEVKQIILKVESKAISILRKKIQDSMNALFYRLPYEYLAKMWELVVSPIFKELGLKVRFDSF